MDGKKMSKDKQYDEDSENIEEFGDLGLNIDPRNFFHYQLFQCQKAMNKDKDLELRKADFIVLVDMLEDMVDAKGLIDDEYEDDVEDFKTELEEDLKNIEDHKDKYSFKQNIPFLKAKNKWKNLFRLSLFENENINAPLKFK